MPIEDAESPENDHHKKKQGHKAALPATASVTSHTASLDLLASPTNSSPLCFKFKITSPRPRKVDTARKETEEDVNMKEPERKEARSHQQVTPHENVKLKAPSQPSTPVVTTNKVSLELPRAEILPIANQQITAELHSPK